MNPRTVALVPASIAGLLILLFVLFNRTPDVGVETEGDSSLVSHSGMRTVKNADEVEGEAAGSEEVSSVSGQMEQSITESVKIKTLGLSDIDAELLKKRQQFSKIAPKPVTFAKSELEKLFLAEKGDEVELPTEPPLRGIVSHNHLHETGGRGFGIRLNDYDGAQFSIAAEPDGTISGHIVQKENVDSFLVSTDAAKEQVVLEKTRADNVVCSWEDRNRKSFLGHLLAEPLEGESEEPEIEPGEQFMVPALESRPGAARVIYLDFDGEVVEGTSWAGGDRIDAEAYRFPSRIPFIFKAMAEDFSPFNVNVTTVRSIFDNADTDKRCMVIFTPTNTAAPGAGGVAYLNSFGSSVNYMCWAFNSGQQVAGETGSHEVGHQLGLRHDGRNTTPDREEYFYGHTHNPTGVSWGPIMGAAFNIDVTHWSKGDYTLANNSEDDYTKMIDDIPYIADDHGDTLGAATDIPTDISLTYNQNGRIGTPSDVDVFRLVLNKAGTVTANADPEEDTYINLDIELEFLDSTGAVIASHAPDGQMNASLTVPGLDVGTYYIRVSGGGLGDTEFAEDGYNDYGSLGKYTLSGTYPFLLIPGIPDGLTATDGVSTDNVFVSWNSSEDTDGYRVYRSENNDSGTAVEIADVTATSYTDTTALHNVVYYYWVLAYNVQGSSDFSATDTGYRRLPLPSTPSGVSATDGSSTAYTRISWSIANFAYEYEVYRNTVNSTSGGSLLTTTSSTTFDDTTGTQGTTYYYYVKSVNPEGESGFSNINSGFRRIPPPQTPGGLSATDGTSPTETVITWNSVALAASYYVYRNTSNTAGGAINIGGTTGALTYSDTTGIAGAFYFYFVRAQNDQGFSGYSAGDSGFRQPVPPVPPTGVDASKGDFLNNVRVNWSPTPDTLDYSVYRSPDRSFDSAVFLFKQTGEIFYDNQAESGRTYYYFVVANNAVGSSEPSGSAIGYTGEEDEADDEYENNDIVQNAHSLKSMEDEWLSSDDGEGVANDTDWYEVKTDSDGNRLDVIVSHDRGENGLQIALFDEHGTEVTPGESEESAQVISYDSASPSTSYYLSVETTGRQGIPYDVFWSSLGAGETGLSVDGTIGFSSAYMRGEGIKNSSGAGQTISHRSRSRGTRSALFSLTNDSAVTEEFVTTSTPGSSKFTVWYFKNENGNVSNVTSQIITSGESTVLSPLSSADIRAYVKPRGKLRKKRRGGHKGGRIYLVSRTASVSDTTVSDTNRFHVQKLKKKPRKKRR